MGAVNSGIRFIRFAVSSDRRTTMPYKVSGNRVMQKKGGKWSTKQICGSPEAAKAAMRLLHGLEHGMKPRSKKKKG